MTYTLLIADDEPLERDALELFVRQSALPVTCIKVKNGKEAVKTVLREDLRVDIAFLDIQMPLLNGLDAAVEIHAARPQLPIVFLTAWGVFDFAQQAIRVGARDYLVKPVKKESVITILEKLVGELDEENASLAKTASETTLAGGDPLRNLRTLLTDRILSGEEEPALKTAEKIIAECKKEGRTAEHLRIFLSALIKTIESHVVSCNFSCPPPLTFAEAAACLASFTVYACQVVRDERQSKYERFFAETRKYLAAHFAENIEMTALAEYLNINAYYFGRLFKEYTGTSFIDYLRSIRLEEAKKLLAAGVAVGEAGKKVGYNDTAYFSRVFKNQFGLSPSEYKQPENSAGSDLA